MSVSLFVKKVPQDWSSATFKQFFPYLNSVKIHKTTYNTNNATVTCSNEDSIELLSNSPISRHKWYEAQIPTTL